MVNMNRNCECCHNSDFGFCGGNMGCPREERPDFRGRVPETIVFENRADILASHLQPNIQYVQTKSSKNDRILINLFFFLIVRGCQFLYKKYKEYRIMH